MTSGKTMTIKTLDNKYTPPIYVFDIDGTLSDTTDRLHYLNTVPRDWHNFYMTADRDPPRQHIVDIAKMLIASGAELWYWTGRSDVSRDLTLRWLKKYVDGWIMLEPDRLRMRPAVDHRHDDVLKEHWLLDRTLEDDRDRIQCVFEDRTRVVNMWRRNGIHCLQVSEGDF